MAPQWMKIKNDHITALLPLIPPAPFSHKGRRGSMGVLMPETRDGTQQLPKKPTPVSPQAGDYMAKTDCAD